MIPSALDHVVKTCLAKDPDERWQSAHDISRELSWISTAVEVREQVSVRRFGTQQATWLTVAVLSGAIMGGFLVRSLLREGQKIPTKVTRASIELPPAEPFEFFFQGPLAISPDGKLIAYVARNREGAQLYLRPLIEGRAMLVPGTMNAQGPFFSPDGRWLTFFANGKLKKVPVSGGASVTIAQAGAPQGGCWTQDGTILLVPSVGLGVFKVAADSAVLQPVTKVESGEGGHYFPDVLPDSKAFLFTIEVSGRSFDDARIAVQSLETGKRKILVEGGRLCALCFWFSRLHQVRGVTSGTFRHSKIVDYGTRDSASGERRHFFR
jgi:eukaryotic-like serine/threonine-protein kinase